MTGPNGDPFARSSLDVRFGPGSVPEFKGVTFVHGEIHALVGWEDSTENGKPAVGFLIRLLDGTIVETMTPWAVFDMAHKALLTKFGEPT